MCTHDTYIYLDDPSGSCVIISKPFLQSQYQAERMLTMLEAGRAGGAKCKSDSFRPI